MRFLITFLAFMAVALIPNFCTAAPHTKPSQDVSSNEDDLINTTFPSIDPNDTANVTISNQCYNLGTSEKWKDVGGQHSDFVNQVVYDLCQLIAVEAYKGFHAGQTIKHCKEVRGGSHGRDYDRSVGVSLRYRGPQLMFNHITAGYCNNRMERPMACGAGGEFYLQVYNPNLPRPSVYDRWEAKADPNRGDCRSNGYGSDLQKG